VIFWGFCFVALVGRARLPPNTACWVSLALDPTYTVYTPFSIRRTWAISSALMRWPMPG
jgi:hypothetical protein